MKKTPGPNFDEIPETPGLDAPVRDFRINETPISTLPRFALTRRIQSRREKLEESWLQLFSKPTQLEIERNPILLLPLLLAITIEQNPAAAKNLRENPTKPDTIALQNHCIGLGQFLIHGNQSPREISENTQTFEGILLDPNQSVLLQSMHQILSNAQNHAAKKLWETLRNYKQHGPLSDIGAELVTKTQKNLKISDETELPPERIQQIIADTLDLIQQEKSKFIKMLAIIAQEEIEKIDTPKRIIDQQFAATKETLLHHDTPQISALKKILKKTPDRKTQKKSNRELDHKTREKISAKEDLEKILAARKKLQKHRARHTERRPDEAARTKKFIEKIDEILSLERQQQKKRPAIAHATSKLAREILDTAPDSLATVTRQITNHPHRKINIKNESLREQHQKQNQKRQKLFESRLQPDDKTTLNQKLWNAESFLEQNGRKYSNHGPQERRIGEKKTKKVIQENLKKIIDEHPEQFLAMAGFFGGRDQTAPIENFQIKTRTQTRRFTRIGPFGNFRIILDDSSNKSGHSRQLLRILPTEKFEEVFYGNNANTRKNRPQKPAETLTAPQLIDKLKNQQHVTSQEIVKTLESEWRKLRKGTKRKFRALTQKILATHHENFAPSLVDILSATPTTKLTDDRSRRTRSVQLGKKLKKIEFCAFDGPPTLGRLILVKNGQILDLLSAADFEKNYRTPTRKTKSSTS